MLQRICDFCGNPMEFSGEHGKRYKVNKRLLKKLAKTEVEIDGIIYKTDTWNEVDVCYSCFKKFIREVVKEGKE